MPQPRVRGAFDHSVFGQRLKHRVDRLRGVHESGFTPLADAEEGARPTLRLISDPALQDVTGRYFDRFRPARAHEQAYDLDARSRLLELSNRLIAPFGGLGEKSP